MGTSATIGVNDDLPARKPGVTMRSADHEFPGRVHIQLEVAFKQLFYLFGNISAVFNSWDKYLPDICFDLFQQLSIVSIKIIMLGRYHDRVNPDGMLIIIILNSDL